MKSRSITFSTGTTEYLFEASLADLHQKAPPGQAIIITDETVAGLYKHKLAAYRILTMPAGESNKTIATIERLAKELIKLEAYRETILVGLGGGVVTDITGFLAGVYMRGLPFGFVPTTLLGMVDAAIGGKNGVNLDKYKNMLGSIRQPAFILFDTEFLSTLPEKQWGNGFAEVIKYSHIADANILSELRAHDIAFYQQHPQQLEALIEDCAAIKNKIVHDDEQEADLRKVLNFGHTVGHAFETLYGLPHGHAVGLGMIVATRLSKIVTGLSAGTCDALVRLLEQYGLPVHLSFDIDKVMELLRMDKKRRKEGIDFVLLEKPGVAVVRELSLAQIAEELKEL